MPPDDTLALRLEFAAEPRHAGDSLIATLVVKNMLDTEREIRPRGTWSYRIASPNSGTWRSGPAQRKAETSEPLLLGPRATATWTRDLGTVEQADEILHVQVTELVDVANEARQAWLTSNEVTVVVELASDSGQSKVLSNYCMQRTAGRPAGVISEAALARRR